MPATAAAAAAATRLGGARLGAVIGLAALTLAVGLGGAGRLTYHEAIVAQAAREMLASGDLLTPTLGGLPWLEKPPLAIWLTAMSGRLAGGLGETSARAPAAIAAALLASGVALLAARRFGPAVGLLAGLVQATTAWTVMRGRLAEADILLAMLVVWAIVAFDRLRSAGGGEDGPSASGLGRASTRWRWGFFAALGLTALAKGVGFGATLVLAVVALVLIWDRDLPAVRRLRFPPGWILAGAVGLTWPVLVVLRHPSVLGLWFVHVSDRFATSPEYFTGQGPWEYSAALLAQLLPWTPLALAGAWRSLPRALGPRDPDDRDERNAGDRLLWAWLVAPLALLSLATVKNAHYAIHALPPCSVWAALGLMRLGERLQARGWSADRVRHGVYASFIVLGLAYALGFALLGPWLDRRGREWAFYETAAAQLRPGEPLALLYHVPEWDRKPYETPFGPVPHDWAVRLFYLGRPAACRFGLEGLAQAPPSSDSNANSSPSTTFAVIGRPTDEPGLARLGRVEALAKGPSTRSDRTYVLYRVTPPAPVALGGEPARRAR